MGSRDDIFAEKVMEPIMCDHLANLRTISSRIARAALYENDYGNYDDETVRRAVCRYADVFLQAECRRLAKKLFENMRPQK